MSTAQSHDLLVIEAHAVEDISQMSVALAGIRQPAVGCTRRHVLVGAAGSEGDNRTLHLLDGDDPPEDPEVGGRDPGELGWKGKWSAGCLVPVLCEGEGRLTLNWLQKVPRGLQPSIGAVVTLGRESHCGTVAAPGAGLLIVGAAGVPGQAHQDGAVGSIVVVVLLLQPRRDLVIHLLVVLELGREDLDLGGVWGLGVEVVRSATQGQGAQGQIQARVRGLGGLGGVATTGLLAEGMAGEGEGGVAGCGLEDSRRGGGLERRAGEDASCGGHGGTGRYSRGREESSGRRTGWKS